MDRDIECLESCLLMKLRDPTMAVYARSIAYFMLFCKNMSLSEALAVALCIDNANFQRLTTKLFDRETQILSFEPRALGTNLVSARTASLMQESLNVKQFALESNGSNERFHGKVPLIKSNILYSDNEFVWLRWYHRGGYSVERTRKFYIVEYRILSKLLIKFPENAYAYKIISVDKKFKLLPSCMYKYHTGNVYDDWDPNIYTNDIAFIYERKHDDNNESICGGGCGNGVQIPSGVGNSSTPSSRNNGSRFYSRQTLIDLENLQFDKNKDIKYLLVVYHPVNVVRISNHLYESYIYKTAVEAYAKQKTSQCSDYIKITALLHYYDRQRDNVSLIFLSELNYFEYNHALFMSNFIKFKYCNLLKEYIFDPRNYRALRAVMEIFSETALFMTTKNLTNISASIQNPLIAFTGERPKTSLTRLCKVNAIHTHQGIRSSQCVNLPMDIGARNTHMEIHAKLNRHQELDPVQNDSRPVDYFCDLSFIQ